MPRVLILCAHRPKRSPSQRYRFEQYLPYLSAKGFEFTFSYLLNEEDDQTFYAKGKFPAKVFILLKSIGIRLKDWFRFKQFDIVFIQREAQFLGFSFFEKRAFYSGAKVIFDFDDSIWLADTSPGNQKWEWIKKPKKFYRSVACAHTVIAGNQYLAEKALPMNPNTVVIPTTIDTNQHRMMAHLRNSDKVVIGWSGSISTIKHFETLVPVLQKVVQQYPGQICVKVMGDPNYTCPSLPLTSIAWTENREVEELNSFDIGLMPLPDDAWANGKCGLKGLSYMACGVATIMSAVGVNKEIIQHRENGLLVSNETEWLEALCLLIENKTLRNQLGMAGRLTVEKSYSVMSQQENYLKVFRDVHSHS